MPSGVNTQTVREVRYEQRCQNKKFEQQRIQRTLRAEKRGSTMTEISKEVSSEIRSVADKKRSSTRAGNSNVSFSSFFW
jgi:hypothetical protein